jgi:hypothetical protein
VTSSCIDRADKNGLLFDNGALAIRALINLAHGRLAEHREVAGNPFQFLTGPDFFFLAEIWTTAMQKILALCSLVVRPNRRRAKK